MADGVVWVVERRCPSGQWDVFKHSLSQADLADEFADRLKFRHHDWRLVRYVQDVRDLQP